MSVNRFGVKKLPYECNWIFESVQYGRWKEWRPYCVKRCPNRDKCKPPDKKKKGDVYKLHPGSIKPYNPPKYRKVGYRGSIRQEVNQATCPGCGRVWNTSQRFKTTCSNQGGKKGCGYKFRIM